MKQFVLIFFAIFLSTNMEAQYCSPAYEWYTSFAAPDGAMADFQMYAYSGYYINDTAPSTGYGSGYVDRTVAVGDTIPLLQGGSYTGTITYGLPAGYTGSQAWIDFNDDGTFSPAEAVSSVWPGYWIRADSTIPANTIVFNIPFSAPAGYHRMRVRNVWYDYDHNYPGGGGPCVCNINTSIDPCHDSDAVNIYWSGVTADYTILIIAGCPFTVSPGSTSPTCIGGSLTLNGTLTFGAASSFTWAGPGGFTASVQNPVISSTTLAAAGVYTLTVTGDSCTVVDTTSVVILNPTATIRGSSSVCSGSSGTVTFTGTPGATVYYSVNGASGPGVHLSAGAGTATISTGVLTTGSSPGSVVYSILGIVSGSCTETISDSLTIIINPKPSAITGVVPLCVGSQITINDADTGGHWGTANAAIASIAGTANTAVVTGITPGVVSLSYTFNGTGCRTFASLTVQALPGIISGPGAVCVGSVITVADTSVGATWSASNSSIATVDASGTVYGVGSGTVIITNTVPTGCYITTSVVVNPLPPAISGALNVCIGSTTSLSDGFIGGSWTSTNPSVATVTTMTGVVSGVSVATDTITYTSIAGCSINATVTVNSLPRAISGASTVCANLATTLSDPSGAGNWVSSNTSLATVGRTTGVVSGVSAGTLIITYIYPATGCQSTTPMTVIAVPPAIDGITGICAGGGTTTLTNTVTGGTWSSSNSGIASIDASSGFVTGVGTGAATISYTVSGCTTTAVLNTSVQPGAIIDPVGDTAMCPGDMVMLTANTGRGYTYQWFSGTYPISGATSEYLETDTAASFILRVTGPLGCSSLSVPMSVTINPASASITSYSAGSICPGTTSTLNANIGTGLSYQWLLDGAGISGATGSVYLAGTNGNYSVVVGNSAGCTATSSAVAISLLPGPTSVVSYTGATSICDRDSLLLRANSDTGITYQWLLNGTNITGATNISYSALNTGNYQVIETNVLSCTSTSAVVGVSVMPLPATSITASGPLAFCTGGSVGLGVIHTTGYSYQWFDNGTALAGSTSNNYTAATGGYYAIKVTATSGCTDITTPPVYVDEITIPSITPFTSTRFCWGGSAFLGVSVTATSGVTFQWMKDGIAIAGATNSTLSANVSGDYSCIVNIAAGCTAPTPVVTLTQNPLPDPIVFYDGTTLSTGNYYVNYQWYRNLVPVSAAVNATYVPGVTGNYTVKVVDTNGCQSVSGVYIVRSVGDSKSLSVNTLSEGEISFYPNPATDWLHISSPQPLRAVLFTVDGRKLISQENVTDLDIKDLKPGLYIITLYNSEGQMVLAGRFVKE